MNLENDFIEKLIKDEKELFYIDIGAGDGLTNSKMLNDKYKWSGICIEENKELYDKLVVNRSPKTNVLLNLRLTEELTINEIKQHFKMDRIHYLRLNVSNQKDILESFDKYNIDIIQFKYSDVDENNFLLKMLNFYQFKYVGKTSEYNFMVNTKSPFCEFLKTGQTEVFYKLVGIHSNLKIKHGKFDDELPEQQMSVKYLTGNEKVLEIGGNIGRNSLIISSILADSSNLVVLETDAYISKQLNENRIINYFNFHIENSALSKRKLIQKGWDTIVSDVLLEGYKPVNCITWKELNNKYKLRFDTLVLDCEGAFYFILMDMPEILTNIKLIIMENDYHDIAHKQYVDKILKKNKFYIDYTEKGGWGCCQDNFFEVWLKK